MSAHNLLAPPLPSCPPSSFTKRLVQVNHLADQAFCDWHWPSGMLFASTTLWWGDNKPRPRPHEGLDLSFFQNNRSEIHSLQEGAMIPSLFSGQIVAIFADFIGQSIMLAHAQKGERRFCSIYAHVLIEPTITIGQHCTEGEIIARIAQSKNATIPAHLHLSTLWLSSPCEAEVDWPKLHRTPSVTWCDPLPFIRE